MIKHQHQGQMSRLPHSIWFISTTTNRFLTVSKSNCIVLRHQVSILLSWELILWSWERNVPCCFMSIHTDNTEVQPILSHSTWTTPKFSWNSLDYLHLEIICRTRRWANLDILVHLWHAIFGFFETHRDYSLRLYRQLQNRKTRYTSVNAMKPKHTNLYWKLILITLISSKQR